MSHGQHTVPQPATSPPPQGNSAATPARRRHPGSSTAARPRKPYRRVLRGIEDGDPLIMGAYQAPGLSAATGYTETGLADDLGLDAGDEALAGAVTAYLDTAAESFWHEAERIARARTCTPPAAAPAPAADSPRWTPPQSAANAARPAASRAAPASYPDCQRDGMDDL